MLWRRLAFVAGLTFAMAAASGAGAIAAQPFDGNWDVVVYCARAPDGAGAYRWHFQVQVRDGSLLGQYNQPGANASGTLSGQIQPDGNALLKMAGRTGRTEYTVGHVQPGTPFHYTATAHFEARSGSGQRNELRSCSLSFTKN